MRVLFVVLAWLLCAGPTAASVIYFGEDGGSIGRVNSDGAGQTTLITGLSTPRHLAIDSLHNRLYWTDPAAGKVQSSNLDGTDVQTLVASGNTFAVGGIAVDPVGGKVWFDVYNFGDPGQMYRMNLDGSGQEILPISGMLNVARGVAVKPDANLLYWLDGSSIMLSNLDGTLAPSLVLNTNLPAESDPNYTPSLQALTMDASTGKLFWTQMIPYGDRTASFGNGDGSNIQTLLTGLANPAAIAVDAINQMVYVGNGWADTIIGVGYDGSNPHIIASGLTNLGGVAVLSTDLPEPGTLALLGVGLLALRRIRACR